MTTRETPRSRREMLSLLGAGALAAAAPRAVAAPAASPVTPDLVEAAKREGQVMFLSAADVLLMQKIANAFQAKYPGIKVDAQRTGSERIFQRLDQEYGSSIYVIDVVESSDASHFLVWKERGWLAPYVAEDVAQHWRPADRDPDGLYASFRTSLSPIGVNTKLVKPEDRPQRFEDLLDPRWRGRMVKSHPGYSGVAMTATYLLARELGWGYLEKLGQQKIMHVQSATEPGKKLAQGERAVAVDGSDYVILDLQEKGSPVAAIYPEQGTPMAPIPTAVLGKAPHPNAARLFQSFLFSLEAQQMLIDVGNSHSWHPLAKEKPGRRAMAELKLWRADPAETLKVTEEIRRKYAEIFGT